MVSQVLESEQTYEFWVMKAITVNSQGYEIICTMKREPAWSVL